MFSNSLSAEEQITAEKDKDFTDPEENSCSFNSHYLHS